MGTISGINICGYDPNLKQIHLYSLDNTGTSHDHAGYWINNKHLFVEYQGVQDGKIYLEQINMIFNSPNEWTINLVGVQNGKVTQKVSGTFKKQK